jgi:hypothetical protein
LENKNLASNQSSKTEEIERLIAELSNKNSKVRENARMALVAICEPAIIPLLKQLRSSDKWVRCESAKALAEMREPSVAPILVDSLANSDPNIRWLAAEGLIALGGLSLVPLMEALTRYSGSLLFAEGAHHVLHDLLKGGVHEGETEYEPLHPLTDEMKSLIKPVQESIGTINSTILTPEYAKAALADLKRLENKPTKSP